MCSGYSSITTWICDEKTVKFVVYRFEFIV